MLTQETKRKIDSARDILVGKVPDPKAQVEQITTALIYKFMDDMDKDSQELRGKARFFTNEYEKYSWSKLMDPKLGGQERLNLYIEAITSMSQNPYIPQLFRDIFKDAYLPYRSPETLNLFLKEINGFVYEHSEDLGDAYEYLLSILGSQGDAGQFRTPRHIIDFIVQAIDPNKDEAICDPACGTAGFLISAYKHIVKKYKDKPLTPDERKKLTDNFVGYDISPDMVRISKVNMYLHDFPNPTIFEYDTLTSEEKWDENFDVMLANPPFMTPKGGIKPHKRFSIQANRAEVLFVDYILEHLKTEGRAGVIVPEGIIFHSANAYKALRKMLLDNGLLAVVSLPRGVFNPYSGVKTSILLVDKALAKKTNNILFIEISNDGFDLGAQRRPIDKNDLPQALEIIKEYKNVISSCHSALDAESIKKELDSRLDGNNKWDKIAHLVTKEKIAQSGDYNLTGDRYREVINFTNQKWPMVAIEDICDLGRGRVISKEYIEKHKGKYPVYSSQTTNNGIFGYIDTYDFDGEYVTWTTDGANAGTVFYRNGKFNCTNVCGTLKSKTNKILMKYLAKILNKVAYKYVIKVGNPKLMNNVMAKIKIPLPPLEVQKEIVEQIEVKQKAIDAAKAVIENLERERRYFGQSLRKLKDVEWVELGEVVKTITPPNKIQKADYKITGRFPIIDQSQNEIAGWTDDENSLIKLERDLVIFGDHTCAIKYVNFPFVQGADGIKILKTNDSLLPKFLYFYLKSKPLESDGYKRHFTKLKQIKIPLPPLEVQKQLVSEMEEQEKIIEANKKLIGIMEKKIEEILKEV